MYYRQSLLSIVDISTAFVVVVVFLNLLLCNVWQ